MEFRFFFCVEKLAWAKQTSHEIWNIKKHERKAGSRQTSNMSRDTKHARRSPYKSFFFWRPIFRVAQSFEMRTHIVYFHVLCKLQKTIIKKI